MIMLFGMMPPKSPKHEGYLFRNVILYGLDKVLKLLAGKPGYY